MAIISYPIRGIKCEGDNCDKKKLYYCKNLDGESLFAGSINGSYMKSDEEIYHEGVSCLS